MYYISVLLEKFRAQLMQKLKRNEGKQKFVVYEDDELRNCRFSQKMKERRTRNLRQQGAQVFLLRKLSYRFDDATERINSQKVNFAFLL